MAVTMIYQFSLFWFTFSGFLRGEHRGLVQQNAWKISFGIELYKLPHPIPSQWYIFLKISISVCIAIIDPIATTIIMIVNITTINTAQYDKSPASAHPGAMSKGSEYVRVHLGPGTTSQPPKSHKSKNYKFSTRLFTSLACGCVGLERGWGPC